MVLSLAVIDDKEKPSIVTLNYDGSICLYETKLNIIKKKQYAYGSAVINGNNHRHDYNVVRMYQPGGKPLIVSSGRHIEEWF